MAFTLEECNRLLAAGIIGEGHMPQPHPANCLCNACIDARPPLPEGPALNVRHCPLQGCASDRPCTLSDCRYFIGPVFAEDEANPKDTLGASKPQMGLVPLVEAVARVMELGSKKYGPFNWRSKAVKKMVYVHAALRHLMAWVGGQSKDPESGESHLAHVAACMLIVLDAEAHGKAIDDREWVKS